MTVQRYEDQLAGLLANMDAKARRELAREIAKQMRQSQQRRIAAQLNPDGTAFEKRKPQIRERKGKLRRTMFAKLRTAKYLKTEAKPNAAVVGFVSDVERIARLERDGVIAGYTLHWGTGEAPEGLLAHVFLSLDARAGTSLPQALRTRAELKRCHTVSGEFDMMLLVAVAGPKALDRLLDDIGRSPGVRRTQSAVVLDMKFERG